MFIVDTLEFTNLSAAIAYARKLSNVVRENVDIIDGIDGYIILTFTSGIVTYDDREYVVIE